MRRTLVAGLVLAVAGVLAIVVGYALELELEPVALLGTTVGAAIALVPDRTALARLGGLLAGVVVAWISYALRASVLPDSASGRAVAIAGVILVGTLIAAATIGRVPLWAVLLGSGLFAGAYETTYTAAPPEMASTSVSTGTALLVCVGLGFLAASLTTPVRPEHTPDAGTTTPGSLPGQRDQVDRVDPYDATTQSTSSTQNMENIR